MYAIRSYYVHERGTFDRVFPVEACLLPSRLSLEVVRLTHPMRRKPDGKGFESVSWDQVV